jgi:hypothetical protein
LGFGYAAIHRHLRELQPDEAVVGIEGDLPESLHYPELDPLIASTAQGALRARIVGDPFGDPFVGAAEEQDLNQFLEDHPIWDAGLVATERWVRLSLRQKTAKLLEDGLDEVRFECGHGVCSFYPGSLEHSPDDGTFRARYSCAFDPY